MLQAQEVPRLDGINKNEDGQYRNCKHRRSLSDTEDLPARDPISNQSPNQRESQKRDCAYEPDIT